jgi:hypothetical protein
VYGGRGVVVVHPHGDGCKDVLLQQAEDMRERKRTTRHVTIISSI